MSAFSFELGQKVRDEVTGFHGTITARCEYSHDGANRYQVTPHGDVLEKRWPEPQWFDEGRLIPTT